MDTLDVRDMGHAPGQSEEVDVRVTRWYEARYTLVTGTWADYEARVKEKLAVHIAKTLEMTGIVNIRPHDDE